ncbi:MAG: RHS repeat-associated core domain-containing protein [Gemmatimonadaceae bacterium]
MNRQTGHFTQEDPIGLAGGINLYGFASGDPVSYSDPFGLCPYFLTGRPCSTGAAIGVGFVPLIGDLYDIASALTKRDLLTGENWLVRCRGHDCWHTARIWKACACRFGRDR